MKTAIFSFLAILLLVILSLFVLPGCNKSSELPALNKPISTKSASLDGKTTTDTVAKPPVQYVTVPLTGDQITLVPHFYKSPTADSSFLYLMAQPKNSYCYNSTLQVSHNLDNNGNYSIGFLDVVEPSPCVGGDSPIFAEIDFTQNPAGNLPVGTFPLTITLNGAIYTGSIISSSTSITFNWNYTSGVIIAP